MVTGFLGATAIGVLANGGPCTAARVVAGASLFRGRERMPALIAFTLGGIAADVALVGSLAFFLHALELSGWWYAIAACTSFVAGLWAISRPSLHHCPQPAVQRKQTHGSSIALPLFAGVGSALLMGACCAPFVAAAAASGASAVHPYGVAMAYALGHASIPLVAILCASRIEQLLLSAGAREALLTVQAGIFFGCAGFFGLLA